MAYFVWNPSYSVGVPTIDEQHRRLVKLINELFDAMQAGRGQDVLGRILHELADYTATHFATEEEYMRRAGYPALDAHKAKHDAMAKRVRQLQRAVEERSVRMTLEVSSFLKGWLQKHILASDMDYSQAMRSAGLE